MAKKAQTSPFLAIHVPQTLREWTQILLVVAGGAGSVIWVTMQVYASLSAQNAATGQKLVAIENGVMLLNKRMDRVEDVLIGERAAKAAAFPDPALSFHDGLAWWER